MIDPFHWIYRHPSNWRVPINLKWTSYRLPPTTAITQGCLSDISIMYEIFNDFSGKISHKNSVVTYNNFNTAIIVYIIYIITSTLAIFIKSLSPLVSPLSLLSVTQVITVTSVVWHTFYHCYPSYLLPLLSSTSVINVTSVICHPCYHRYLCYLLPLFSVTTAITVATVIRRLCYLPPMLSSLPLLSATPFICYPLI